MAISFDVSWKLIVIVFICCLIVNTNAKSHKKRKRLQRKEQKDETSLIEEPSSTTKSTKSTTDTTLQVTTTSFQCSPNEIITDDDGKCEECPKGWIPKPNKAECVQCDPDKIASEGECKECPDKDLPGILPNEDQTECSELILQYNKMKLQLY